MILFRTLAASAIICVFVSGSRADEKEYPKLIIGKWEVIKNVPKKDLPAGSVVEFTKDGKVKLTIKEDGKEETHEMGYELKGSTLIVIHKPGPEGKKTATIKKLTEKEFILEDKPEYTELRRKK